MMQQMLLGNSVINEVEIGDWVPSQGGYYAGLLTTGTESFDNLDPAGTQYHVYIAEKSVSQSLGQYKTSASCDGGHTYPGDTTAPNAAWSGYFNTYQSSVANAGASHPIFNTVQNLSITVDGNVFDDWYIPAHQEAGVVYGNLENATGWQSSSQAFDTSSAGSSNDKGELWTSTGDSCNNTGVLTSAGKWFANNGIVYGYPKNDTSSIRPVRRVPVSSSESALTGQVAYTTPGTYTWTAPANITSVCVVCVGGGGKGGGAGGGGGGLGWRNNITVTPGSNYTVVVGAAGTTSVDGGDSYFSNTGTVRGEGGHSVVPTDSTGGGYFGDGGGNGGNGSSATNWGGGGGGAGGYSGNGGNAGTGSGSAGSGGAGGGGAGHSDIDSNDTKRKGGGGGGVGILGEGSSGAGAPSTTYGGDGGEGGSGGGDGSDSSTHDGGDGGAYGGGSGGTNDITGNYSGDPGTGAVRIIWGAGRAFPSTHTGDL